MKLIIFLLTTAILQVSASSFAQRVTINLNKAPLTAVFKEIRKQTGYDFFYSDQAMKKAAKVNINVKDVDLKTVMEMCMADQQLSYRIEDKIIMVKEKVTVDQLMRSTVQPRIYIGVVHDEHDQPLTGVGIKIKGSNLTTSTNLEGRFTTPVITDPQAVLIFSYIGYVTEEIKVSELKAPIIIKLKVANSDLDQVQITAYGSTSRRYNSGSSVTITASDIEKNPARNILEVLKGQVPGLFVQQLSGLPGTPFNLMIRGQQTLTNGFRASQPLIIVDGVALPSGPLPIYHSSGGSESLSNQLRGGNPLDYLDPSTIETLTVLKDADATSIYGSRGAYGVILITTKKGKAGQPKLNLNATSGITVRGTAPELLNTEQYKMLRTEAYKNDGTPITNTPAFADINGPNADRYTDFQEILAGNHAALNRINASYSGGTSDISFLLGGNYRQQNSIQIGKGSVRDGGINFNINNSVKDNKFSVNLSGSFLSTTDDAVPYDFSQSAFATRAPNAAPLFLPDGSLNWEEGTNAASAMHIIFKNVTNNLFSNLGLKYTPVKGLTLNTTIGYNYMNSKELRAQPTAYYQPGTNFRTTSTLNLYSIRNITVEPNMSYKTALGSKGNLTLQTGATLQNQLTYQTTTTGNDFLSDDMLYNPAFADPLTSTGQVNLTTFYDQIPNKYLGFFGILNYNWDNKYILNINARRDGSTKFGENNQFGDFGSIAGVWILSSENWFKGLTSVVSFAKLRASAGTSGGDDIANYGYLTTYSKGNTYQGSLGLRADNLQNKDLHWEHNKKIDVGMTLEFFAGRITADANYNTSKTTDQLVNQLLPSTTGFLGRQINSPAIIKNYGWEFELSTKNISTKNFTWTTRINGTLPKNELVAYPGLDEVVTNTNYRIGESVQGVRVYNYAGVDPETGLHNFINREGIKGTYRLIVDPVTLDANLDKTEFVDLSVKFYGGLGNNFTYKGFSLDVLFTFTDRIGKTFLGSQTFPAGWAGQNLSTSALDRWQKPGDITKVQRAGAGLSTVFAQSNFVASSGAYGNAFFARLNSLNLSYTLPVAFAKKLHLSGLSVFGQGANLLTISKYGDLDPENLGAGMAPLRNFSGGLRISL